MTKKAVTMFLIFYKELHIVKQILFLFILKQSYIKYNTICCQKSVILYSVYFTETKIIR